MAQYYGITDESGIDPLRLATLICGLPKDSRLMRALSGRKATQSDLLLAAIVDRLSMLVWFKTKDGMKGRNRPASIVERMTREDEENRKAYSVPVDRLEAEIKRIRAS